MPPSNEADMDTALMLSDDAGRSKGVSIILIERRALVRECLATSLQRASGYNVLAFATAETWVQSADPAQACLIVLCTGDEVRDEDVGREISVVAKLVGDLPLVVICGDENADQIVKALEAGARGVIPTNLPLAVAVEAMRLVAVGGTFVPASCLTALQRPSEVACMAEPNGKEIFTSRQAAVIEALRRGKANKIIAYELNMRESTVKVHVRNIMKKLKARNRTEVAYIANGMMTFDRHRGAG